MSDDETVRDFIRRLAAGTLDEPFTPAEVDIVLAELDSLRAERDSLKSLARTLAEALRWLLEDERYTLAVGGNPNAVTEMLAAASSALSAARENGLLKEGE